ncbi:hypothetical protein BDV12DRAFT_159382 [Aspergillus spectabilis]
MATDEKPEWYQKDAKSINSDAQQLLEKYSGFKSEDVLPHVLALRDEAFKICPYPCIGQMRFLSLHLKRHLHYERVLEYLRNNSAAGFLDAGCCVGQEIRFLTQQGIPDHQLFGLDLEQPFVDLGYQLFRDKDRLDATFVLGDLHVDEESEALAQKLEGKIGIVYASSLLHLWSYEKQLRAATRLVSLLCDEVGVMVVGRQLGGLYAGEFRLTDFNDDTQYRHNVQSIKGLWYGIEQATGTRWKVEVWLIMEDLIQQIKNMPWGDSNMRVVWWSATRIS